VLVQLFAILLFAIPLSHTIAAPPQSSVFDNTRQMIIKHKFPRLVVVIAVDQFRYDYITRFSDLFLPSGLEDRNPGGLGYLLHHGAFFADAHFSHLPLFTGPGHATILTGASPSETGIVSNDWLTTTLKSVNCVQDDAQTIAGEPPHTKQQRGKSPVRLLVPTVTDELRLANNRASKVVGVAIKDRGAILMAGHNPDACAWFDSNTGNWVTSTYYTTGSLPKFIAEANRKRVADQWIGKSWDYLLPKENYTRVHGEHETPGQGDALGLGLGFPKQISPAGASADNSKYYGRLIFTPFGIKMTFDVAQLAIQEEKLGQDSIPDILAISISSPDLAGHTYGPHSPEMMDCVLRLDRYLSDFFNFLSHNVPGGLSEVDIVLTADHGSSPLPDWANQSMRLNAGRIAPRLILSAAKDALAAAFPDKRTSDIVAFHDPYIYFNQQKIQDRQIDRIQAEDAVASAVRNVSGIYTVYTRDQILKGRLPSSRLAQYVYNGFNEQRSGDLFVISMPYHYPSGGNLGTSHGTAYDYDTHVPLCICGKFVKSGFYTERVDIRDIAPTLSFMLGIGSPAASQGRILGEIF
jgi:predicted AlkP superfamily pyrophosphatase or phosphodiesterase